jgi:PAS domain S-box-containing protein
VGTFAAAEIAAIQRHKNAGRASAALALLAVLAIGNSVALHAKPAVIALLAVMAAAQALAYGIVRSGRTAAGILFCGACIYAEHIGVVAIDRDLGPLPFLAPLVIMLVAATLESRWLLPSFVLCLATLAVEGWLSPWHALEQQSVTTAALFASVVFVMSLLHVRGTEHAFRIAAQQDEARARAAAEAVESERRYRLIADASDDLIALVNAKGEPIYQSPSHERVLGPRMAAKIGASVGELLTPEELEATHRAFSTAMERGSARVEVRARPSQGAMRIMDVRFKRIEADEGPLVVSTSRDVTEQRDLEERLHATERLDALGRLAGSVAHDFNNLLTVIGGGAELARDSLPPDHVAIADLDSVLRAAQAAGALARELLTFSRRQIVVPTRLDLAEALANQRDLLVRIAGRHVTLAYEIDRDLPFVMMSQTHFEQFTLNMVVNARDAMPAGGGLRFILRSGKGSDPKVGQDGASAIDEYVDLEVRDEGVGIPPEVLPHVFEPFFSTKGAKGTGLGLATCYGIVTQAGGTIRVESEVGRGTAFFVRLPAVGSDRASEVTPRNGGAVRRVLVVDDESIVLDTVARMLRSEGFEVCTAANLAEGRSVLRDGSIAIDLLLADVMLGAERGTDLIADCRRDRPEARVVIMSGYAADLDASDTLASSGAAFLAKPFARDALLAVVRHSE